MSTTSALTGVLRKGVFQGRRTAFAYDHITLKTRHPVRSGKLSNVGSRTDWRPAQRCIPGTKDSIRLRPHHVENTPSRPIWQVKQPLTGVLREGVFQGRRTAFAYDHITLKNTPSPLTGVLREGVFQGRRTAFAYDHITLKNTPSRPIWQVKQPLTGVLREGVFQGRRTAFAYDHITLKTRHPVRSGKLSNVESRTDWRPARGCIPGTKDSIRLRPHHVENTPSRPIWQVKQPLTGVLREGVFQGRRTAFAYDHITLKTRHPVRSGKLSNVESRTDWRPARGCIPGTKDSIRLRPHHVEKHAIPSDLATLTGVLREGVFQGRRTAFAYDHITLKTRHPVRSGKLSNVESRTDWRPARKGVFQGRRTAFAYDHITLKNTPSRPIWQVKQPLTGVLREGVFQGRRTAFAYDHITLKNTPSRPIWQVKQPLTGVLREGVFQGRRTAFAYDHITLKNTPSRPIWQVKQPLTGVLREGVFQGRRTAFAYDHITLKNTPSRPIWQVKQPLTGVLRKGVFQGRRTAFAYDHITLKTRHPVRSGKLSNVESRTDWRPARGCTPGTKDSIRLRPHHVENTPSRPIWQVKQPLTGVLRKGVFQGRRTAFAYDHITLKTRHPVRSGKLSNVESRTDWRPAQRCIPGTKDSIRLRPHHVEKHAIPSDLATLTGVLRKGCIPGTKDSIRLRPHHVEKHAIPSDLATLTGVLREGVLQGRRTAFAYDHITLKTRHPVRSGKLSNVESRTDWRPARGCTPGTKDSIRLRPHHVEKHAIPTDWRPAQRCIPGTKDSIRLRPHHVENTPSRPIWQVKQPLTGVLREGVLQGRRTAFAYDHITLKTRHPVRSGKLSNVESRTDWRPARGCIPGTKDSIRLRPHHVEKHAIPTDWRPARGCIPGTKDSIRLRPHHVENTPSRPIWQVKQPLTGVLREGVFQGRRTAFAYDHITLKTRHPVRSGKLSNVESRTDWRPARGCIPGTKDSIRLRPHHVENTPSRPIWQVKQPLTGVLREGVFQGRRTAFAYDHITLKTRHPVRSGKLSNVESRTDWRPARGCIPGTKDSIRLRPHHVEKHAIPTDWRPARGCIQGRRTAFAYDHITLKNTPSRPIWQVKQPLTGVLREGVFQGRRTAFAYDHITLKNTPSRPIWQVKQPLTGVLREGVFQGRRTAFAYDHITLKTRHPVRSGKLSNVESR
ncbi:unnamed protein product [Caenorhabditis auriculariae]|uniref:Uncharacterized protein n=1 Tax=Caenorhabditis auriculariae TaxID=2777116 RepID=A0A8S1HSQ3_9PELO|nr:unnamed protein product [Caenorhabditis auriculariae]